VRRDLGPYRDPAAGNPEHEDVPPAVAAKELRELASGIGAVLKNHGQADPSSHRRAETATRQGYRPPMNPTGDLTESRSISCPFCGRRSSLTIELPVTETKRWIHHCPICGKPWKVTLGVRRGLPQLDVTPDVASNPKPAKKAKTTKKPRKAKTPAKAKPPMKSKTAKKAKKAKPKR
jgi:transcription elongation factor Elf1